MIAVLRGDETFISPSPKFEFADEDILILFGKNENLEKAIEILQGENNGFNP